MKAYFASLLASKHVKLQSYLFMDFATSINFGAIMSLSNSSVPNYAQRIDLKSSSIIRRTKIRHESFNFNIYIMRNNLASLTVKFDTHLHR